MPARSWFLAGFLLALCIPALQPTVLYEQRRLWMNPSGWHFKPNWSRDFLMWRIQDGQRGHDHEQWHGSFYNKLMRPDGKGSCCNMTDCRPTSIRDAGDHQEIMKDGRWIRLDPSKIVRDAAPDGRPHICAPNSPPPGGNPLYSFDADVVYCIVMPQEI